MSRGDFACDLAIVGSGPAGVSAAWPLVGADRRVVMLDPGVWPPGADIDADGSNTSYMETRQTDPDQWRLFFGDDFAALAAEPAASPKLRAPAHGFVYSGFAKAYGLSTRNFMAVGSLARGGLSNAWGAGAYAYDDDDLKAFPVSAADLAPSFRAVAERIGLSGVDDDDDMAAFYGRGLALQPPLPLHDNATRLLERYRRQRDAVRATGLRLGRARNAVLSRDLGERRACDLGDLCLWGCRRGAIYNAAFEVEALERAGGFTYRPGVFVAAVEPIDGGYCLRLRDAAGGRTIGELTARRVILAAGTLGSTALVGRLVGRLDTPLAMQSNPAVAFPVILPARIGAGFPERGFSMGQLGYRVDGTDESEPYAHGVLFAATALPMADLARRLPFSRPGSLAILRWLMPSMLLANCFLAGTYSAHRITVTANGLTVEGAYGATFAGRVRTLARTLRAAFARLGGLVPPGSAQVSRPGADIHYAATLPMRAAPGGGALPSVDPGCSVHGFDGLYVVDGACLSGVTAKNPTFTIMANADRIGRLIARDGR